MNRWLLTITAVGLIGASPLAAARPPRPPAATANDTADKSAGIFAARLGQLDGQLATLLMRRAQTSAAQLPLLDMSIDLRVLGRWMFAASAGKNEPLNVAALLRCRQALLAAAMLEQSPPLPLNRAKSQALVQLHQLSYELPPLTDAAQLDQAGQKLGKIIWTLAGNDEAAKMTLMRPAPLRAVPVPDGGEGKKAAPAGPPPIERLSISPVLRNQLLSLRQQAQSLAAERGQEPEAQLLQQALDESVAFAAGLAENDTVSTAIRQDLETRLGEGLALYADARTREAGQTRLRGLDEYRRLFSRAGKLPVSDELRKRLAGVFSYAQEHPDQSAMLLQMLEDFAQLGQRFQALEKNATVLPNVRHGIDELRKAFENQAGQFVSDAQQLNTAGMLSAGPRDLQAAVAELRWMLRALEQLENSPAGLEALNDLKPKPFGAIERRLALAASALAGKPAQRAESQKYLDDIMQLSQAARRLAARPAASLPADVAKAYGADQAGALDNRLRLWMGELASQLAAGAALDGNKLARVSGGLGLVDALWAAMPLQSQRQGLIDLQRWVDWAMSQRQWELLLEPYQQSLAAAAVALVNDKNDAADRLLWAQSRYGPLLALLGRDLAYANAAAALPGNLTGVACQLATPLADQPFASERIVSYYLDLWSAGESAVNYAASDAALLAAARRAAAEMNLPFNEKAATAGAAPANRSTTAQPSAREP